MATETKKFISLDNIELLYTDLLQQIEQKYTRPKNGIGRKDLHAKILDDLDNKVNMEEWYQKADSIDTTLYTTLSRGRASDSTIGNYSFAFGSNVTASGETSHAEGIGTTASKEASHAEGAYTIASEYVAHAEGQNSQATGVSAHAEGAGTKAQGAYAHAEGDRARAVGQASHAEGYSLAGGKFSHSEGTDTEAVGQSSHTEGYSTAAYGRSQHVFGEYNILDTYGYWSDDPDNYTDDPSLKHKYVEIVGNGTADSQRSNARTLDWSGNESLAGSITLGKGTADEVTVTATQMKALLALLNT